MELLLDENRLLVQALSPLGVTQSNAGLAQSQPDRAAVEAQSLAHFADGEPSLVESDRLSPLHGLE